MSMLAATNLEKSYRKRKVVNSRRNGPGSVAADGLSASHQDRAVQVAAHCRQLGPWGMAIVSACEQNLIGARVCLG